MSVRSRTYISFGIILLLVSFYAFMGVIQAGSLFVGARALTNGNFWGSVCVVAFFASAYCFWHIQDRKKQTTVSSTLKAMLGLSVLAFGAWFAWPVVADSIAIDRCLDGGGSFNHVLSQCDMSLIHPYLSTFNRQGFRIVMFTLSLLVGLLFMAPFLRSHLRR